MDVLEMHQLFRTLGQQMGLQLIRGILPESIDAYLNDATMEVTRNIISSNVSTIFEDKVTLQKNPISQINSVKTLYSRLIINVADNKFSVPISNRVMFYTSFDFAFGDKTYKARFIEIDKLFEVLNDYCNGASLEYPVVTYNGEEDGNDIFEVFVGNDKSPDTVNVNIIKLPKKIKYSDTKEERVDCDLPEHLHSYIVEVAVNKYFQSVGSTSHNVD